MIVGLSSISGLLLGACSTGFGVSALPSQLLHRRQEIRCTDATFSTVNIEAPGLPAASISVKVDTTDPGGLLGRWKIENPNAAEVCNVKVTVVPEGSDNPISFAVYLPAADSSDADTKWNQRFLTVGNGLFDGGIQYNSMFQYLTHGFASMSTNTGHEGEGAAGAAAMNTENKQKDWSWRAMAYSVPMAKNLVSVYYDQTAKSSFYAGCSTGGRQGLRQLEFDPQSFNGALIGAPAWDTTNILPWVTFLQTLTALTPQQIQLIESQMITAQCFDAGTGAARWVRAPVKCKKTFDDLNLWSGMACNATNPPAGCFEDINQAKNFVKDDLEIQGTNFRHAGYDLSAVRFWQSYIGASLKDVAAAVRRVILNGAPDWGDDGGQGYYASLTAWADQPDMKPQVNPRALGAFGGKMILYNGLRDGLLPAGGTFGFYQQVPNKDSIRYYEIPGMEHCANLAAPTQIPWYIGGVGLVPFGTNSLPYIPKNSPFNQGTDALSMLVTWAEGGDEPRDLTAVGLNAQRQAATQETVSSITERK